MLQKKFIAAWKAAATAKNLGALAGLLADHVELVSPVAFKPYNERRTVLGILAAVVEVLPDMTYTRCESTETGAIMMFEGTVKGTDLRVEGIDVFQLGLDGKAMQLKVFVRPLNAAAAFAEAMGKALLPIGSSSPGPAS